MGTSVEDVREQYRRDKRRFVEAYVIALATSDRGRSMNDDQIYNEAETAWDRLESHWEIRRDR